MAPNPDPEHVRQLTREVLSRPEFNATSYQMALLRYLVKLFEELSNWSGNHPFASTVLIAVLLAVLVALIVHLIYTAVTELRFARKGPRRRQSVSVSRALEEVAADWNAAARMAREALAAGDAYRAIWIAHRLLLDALDRAGAIRFSKWKTNTDYLRECAGHPPHYGTLDEITAVYDAVVYAHREVNLQTIATLLDRVEQEHARA